MTSRTASRCAAALLLWTGLAPAIPEPRVVLAAPRDFGYTLGDIVQHRITVAVPEPYTLETTRLPKPGALDENLEVRAVDWRMARRDGAAIYRIAIDYQVFKGVRATERATVPPLPLHMLGPEPRETEVPAWEFTVAPLIAPEIPDAAVAIRPGLPPVALPTAPIEGRLAAYCLGIAAALAYLGWLRIRGKRANRPFARAHRELRRLACRSASVDAHRAAARLLHKAFNESAGHALFAEQLGQFCENRPEFAGLREDLAEFFALSHWLFFAAPEAPAPADDTQARLLNLSRRCALAERRLA